MLFVRLLAALAALLPVELPVADELALLAVVFSGPLVALAAVVAAAAAVEVPLVGEAVLPVVGLAADGAVRLVELDVLEESVFIFKM